MPTKCSVRGCDIFYGAGNPFFNLPTELKYKYAWEKAQLAKKRKKLWLEAMGAQDDEASKMIRICSKHFLSGKPAALEDTTDIDWVPSFNMNLSGLPATNEHNKKAKEQDRGKKNISKRPSSSQQSTSSQRPTSSQTSASSQKSHRSASSHRSVSSHRSASSHRSVPSERSSSKNTKNNAIKKSDKKKLLNCKVLLDGTLTTTTFNGTNGSGLAILQKHGSFTSGNVTLNEAAINNTILRIHLCREDLNGLKRQHEQIQGLHSNKRKRKVQQVSSFGRQIKKTKYFYDYEGTPSVLNKKVPNVQQSPQQSPSVNSEVKQFKNNSFMNANKAVDTQMRDKREVDERKSSAHHKLEATPAIVRHSHENNKTLNRTIQKNNRDNIKVKFFPRTSTPMKNAINRSISEIKSEKALQLHREILFVKQYKNDHLHPKHEQTFYLKFPNHRYHEDGMLNYAFQKLVTDVKHMKLPAPSWKIKVIIRQGKISAITFTNKLALERCVAFSLNSDRYRITIDNRPALLLGSPNSVNDASELEVLLDIIESIESDSPMIFYK